MNQEHAGKQNVSRQGKQQWRKATLPVKRIHVHEELQNRRGGLDKVHLKEMINDISATKLKVPLIVFDVDGIHWLVSGHHRLEAIKAIREKEPRRFPTVNVRIYTGSFSDARAFSYRQNLQTVKAFTRSEKTENAYQALIDPEIETYRRMSTRDAGKLLGVTHTTVSRMHKALDEWAKVCLRHKGSWMDNTKQVKENLPTWVRARKWIDRESGGARGAYQNAIWQGRKAAEEWEQDSLPGLIQDSKGMVALESELRERLKMMKPYMDDARDSLRDEVLVIDPLPASCEEDFDF